ncbi:hypothetical protein HI914_02974 [Erysiphe necator]|nr:hypothetical protein HI914_02974 [Erysiphe necator]
MVIGSSSVKYRIVWEDLLLKFPIFLIRFDRINAAPRSQIPFKGTLGIASLTNDHSCQTNII